MWLAVVSLDFHVADLTILPSCKDSLATKSPFRVYIIKANVSTLGSAFTAVAGF